MSLWTFPAPSLLSDTPEEAVYIDKRPPGSICGRTAMPAPRPAPRWAAYRRGLGLARFHAPLESQTSLSPSCLHDLYSDFDLSNMMI